MQINKILIFLVFFSFSFSYASNIIEDPNKIFKNLRCLVCQGQSIADSNSEFAQTIKLVVVDQIKSGKSEREIYDFLVEKYGEWIVYKPTYSKHNFFLWFLPYLVLLLGGLIIFLFTRKAKYFKDN
tara:strand:+ start:287 stop:664 length:378 start_codon:yes stop_codon:yes gene_type:complete